MVGGGKVGPASVGIEDGQPQLPSFGHAVRVHVEGLIPHELGGEEIAHRLAHTTESADQDVVTVILLRVGREHDAALHGKSHGK